MINCLIWQICFWKYEKFISIGKLLQYLERGKLFHFNMSYLRYSVLIDKLEEEIAVLDKLERYVVGENITYAF